MKKSSTLFGFISIITGLAIAVFTAFMYLMHFTLMEYIAPTEQYIMGAILATIFIVIGFLIMLE
jgi:uncharacterized membrane protein